MNQLWIFFAVASTFIDTLTAFTDLCEVDSKNKSATIYNLKNNCKTNELRNMFLNLTAGTFPANGNFRGHILPCPFGVCRHSKHSQNALEVFWSGKTLMRTGTSPKDHGTVTNTLFARYVMCRGTIYRTKAPIDGKEVFVLDYKGDFFCFNILDYIRKLQTNLYLGIAVWRGSKHIPFLYFLLEIDRD